MSSPLAMIGNIEVIKVISLVISIALLSCVANGEISRKIGLNSHRSLVDATASSAKAFDITEHGAKADGKTDNAMALMKTWRAACDSGSAAKVVVPKGTFVSSPVVFQGPCKGGTITFQLQGTIQATTDLSQYTEPEWVSFEIIDGLNLNGGGVFDGQGVSAWKYNDCKQNNDCMKLPDNIKLRKVKNAVIDNVSSVNSKYFHWHVTDSNGIKMQNLKITAPGNSPNTDGMHISNTHGISVSGCTIGTGDDCVSVGQGVTNLTVSGVVCGPGHGISVGSLGKYKNEEDVSGIRVTNCTLLSTTNGVRIKTYPASPPSQASNIIFDGITMDNVQNPVIIDQKYGSHKSQPSRVKISDVHFKNIKGTSTSNVAVSISCSSLAPCEGVELANINLKYVGAKGSISASCSNAKIKSVGTQNPSPCA